MATTSNKLILILASLTSGLLLGGCMLNPSPVTAKKQLLAENKALAAYLHNQLVINKPISLAEAIARALKYNLDNRVREAQVALASGQLTLAKLSLLPGLENTYTFSKRNNPLVTLNNAFEPSVTTVNPRMNQEYKVHVTWNILDLGLNLIQTKQQADRVLIAREQQRKVEQQLVSQVIIAYWKAYSAQQMIGNVERYQKQVTAALKRSQKSIDTRAASKVVQLDYQQTLIGSLRQLIKLEMQLNQAREDLTRLINAEPGSHFKLKSPPAIFKNLPKIKLPMVALDAVTLVNRPELREAYYKERIARYGVATSVLQLLPTADFKFGYNFTSNVYLKNRVWYDTNINATWDAIKLLQTPFAINNATTKIEFERLSMAAMTMGALTQVRIAYNEYHIWQQDYQYSRKAASNAKKLFIQTQRLAKANMSNQQAVIRRGIASMNARLDQDLALAKAYETLGRLRLAVGLNYLTSVEIHHATIYRLMHDLEVALYQENTDGFERQVLKNYRQLRSYSELIRKTTGRSIEPKNTHMTHKPSQSKLAKQIAHTKPIIKPLKTLPILPEITDIALKGNLLNKC